MILHFSRLPMVNVLLYYRTRTHILYATYDLQRTVIITSLFSTIRTTTLLPHITSTHLYYSHITYSIF